jgi:hypothetical protein
MPALPTYISRCRAPKSNTRADVLALRHFTHASMVAWWKLVNPAGGSRT